MELKPERNLEKVTLGFPIEAHGYGAILATKAEGPELKSFLQRMKTLSQKRLQSFPHERPVLSQHAVKIPATAKASAPQPGTVRIPAGSFDFQVSGIMIEGSNEIGVDVQYP